MRQRLEKRDRAFRGLGIIRMEIEAVGRHRLQKAQPGLMPSRRNTNAAGQKPVIDD